MMNRRATNQPGLMVAVRGERSAVRAAALGAWLFLAAIFLAVILLVGCQGEQSAVPQLPKGQPTAKTKSVAKKSGVRTERELGPVRVTVEVVPAPARLSDEPILTVTVSAMAGVEAQLPQFGEIGEFDTRDFREPLVEVRGDREVSRQVYVLEPQRTGTLEIDPFVVTFTDNRPGKDAAPQRLETEALAVEVYSLESAEAPSLDDLHGYAPPVELPRPIRWWWWLVGATLISVVLVMIVVWWRRRGARDQRQPQLSPREIASLELQRIWQEQLHVRDIKLFYTELTGIVRRYIEGTVGVRAPEQTTEEFLREISTGNVFSEDERRRLGDFLESSDLVKFAAHQPDRNDIDDAYQRARVFVGINGDESGEGVGEDAREDPPGRSGTKQQVASHD